MLLDRMTNIMEKKGNLSVDRSQQTLSVEKKSLNKEVRKKDLIRITKENHRILQRLTHKTSEYSVMKWEEDFQSQERIRKNIQEHPDPRRSGIWTFRGPSDSELKLPEISRVNAHDTSGASKSHSHFPIRKSDIDENRIVLYKKGRMISDHYYIVEISQNNQQFMISAYDVESPENYLITIPKKQ